MWLIHFFSASHCLTGIRRHNWTNCFIATTNRLATRGHTTVPLLVSCVVRHIMRKMKTDHKLMPHEPHFLYKME